ncbi:hypothetical protein L6164_036255 [Bauhinia variegata]|uniref:Uncharacterized protein n=1 Tax=Bauhinia variegata TaxID=167791 RepID=A0ACB9KGI0_BAUVA|nr:hypothetical protein L6164_036255 [Bauhinia variegata]
MVESPFAWKNKSAQKPVTFSDSEIEVAKQLIQLSSGDSDVHNDEDSTNNNYSVLQRTSQGKQSRVDSGEVTYSAAMDNILAEAEDETFPRRNKRYRYIEDLYSVTQLLPVSGIREKKKIKRRN